MSASRVVVLILAALVIVTSATPAQPPDTAWVRIWDYAPDGEYIMAVRALSDGGFIAAGVTDVDDVDNQSWIARLNSSGEVIWENIEGDEQTQGTFHIEQTSDGGFVHCGDDLVTPTPQIVFQAFVRKLDEDGRQQWRRTYNPNQLDYAHFVTEVPTTSYPASLQPGPPGGYVLGIQFGTEGTVLRLGPDGESMWSWSLGNSAPRWVEPGSDGGFFVPTRIDNAFVLVKLDHNGEMEWLNNESMPGEVRVGYAHCVRESDDGFLYAGGTVDDDGGSGRFYVAKRDLNGEIIWWTMIAQNAFSSVFELDILGDGNIAAAGSSHIFGEDREIWLVKIDSETGDVLWHYEETYGEAESVDQARDGGIIMSVLPLELGNDYPLDLKLVKFEPEVVVELTPQATTVPAEGGMIRYMGAVSNMLLDPTPQRVWASVITPAGQEIPLQVIPITLQPGGSFTSGVIQAYVPEWMPAGEYRYCLHIGAKYGDPLRNMGYDEFTFVKEGDATENGGRENGGLTPSVEGSVPGFPGREEPVDAQPVPGIADFADATIDELTEAWLAVQPDNALAALLTGDAEMRGQTAEQTGSVPPFPQSSPELPDVFAVNAYPNPFNASTTVTVTLPHASELSVVVYNLTGQIVATLADRETVSAGRATYALDGTGLASGTYLIKATTGSGRELTRRVIVLK